VKVAIIGYGRMGRNHKRVLEQLGHEVVTLDRDPAAGADLVFGQLEMRIQRMPFDAFCVSTPIASLRDAAERLGSNGLPLLIEKPGAESLYQLRAAHELGNVTIGYTERFNPAVEALKENLHRVGVVQHFSARRLGYAYDRAGDPALDLATHDLDVLDYLFGDEARPLLLDHVARSRHHVSALLHYDTEPVPGFPCQPCSVSIEASHLHPTKVRQLEIVGSDGVLCLDYTAQSLYLAGVEPIYDGMPHVEPLVREWEAFFRGEGSDGIAAMRIAEQMVEAEPSRIAA